ncbi:tyrosine-type recombinase/integrase [Metabacillus fastidiosus]|uniref:tyrosine-type recombinase/integrase n=1 Tax=Metabacillus fastidiosus TaxID=1458 RepID=UPI003D2E5D5B
MKATKASQFHHYMIALLLLRTELWKGEMLALTWDDIDMDHKTLSVTKSKNEFGVK